MHSLELSIVLLNAYCFGANCVERFVNYESWPMLAQSAFATYHRAQQRYILAFIVAPQAVAFVLQVALCAIKPVDVSWWVVGGMAGASLVGVLSTALFQIPIHRRLSDDGYSEQQVQRLLRTDWIRKAADIVRMVATVALLRATMH